LGTGAAPVVSTGSRNVSTSTAWIPINLSLISVGSPIGQWPADPLNTLGHTSGAVVTSTDHFYSYAASSTSAGGFKLGALMESQKYSTGGSGDIETNDGGSYIWAYEQGSNVSL
jgi:hypothetical protein